MSTKPTGQLQLIEGDLKRGSKWWKQPALGEIVSINKSSYRVVQEVIYTRLLHMNAEGSTEGTIYTKMLPVAPMKIIILTLRKQGGFVGNEAVDYTVELDADLVVDKCSAASRFWAVAGAEPKEQVKS